MESIKRKMCANCVWRGQTFESRDESGIQHCTLLDSYHEDICIDNDYLWWKAETELAKEE